MPADRTQTPDAASRPWHELVWTVIPGLTVASPVCKLCREPYQAGHVCPKWGLAK